MKESPEELHLIRDRFAVAALAGILASDQRTDLETYAATADAWANCAYAIADAMMKRRER